MPRSVMVLSNDPNLMESARRVLLSDPRFVDTADGLHCNGVSAPLTNVYPIETVASDWEGWNAEDSSMPDPRGLSTLVLECRSGAWVSEIGRLLAQGLGEPVWVVDCSDRAWPADRVEPDRIALA